MHQNHIRIPLGLEGVRIVRQETGRGGEMRVVVVRTTEREACPRCQRITSKRHDARECVKADIPLGERAVSVVVIRRRFRCVPCQHVFTEPDRLCGTRRRLTRRLRTHLGQACLHQTVARVAQVHGVSPTTVRRALTEVVAAQRGAPSEAPEILGIDEFSLRKGRRYATGLHDLQRQRVIDVFGGRTQETVQAALERLADPDAVSVVSMDMAGNYRAAVQEVLPRAAIVVDKFHVVKRVTEAVRDVWQRLLRRADLDDSLRRDGRLVLWGKERLTADQWTALNALLRRFPPLRQAYLLKEDFRRWYRCSSRLHARLELHAWRRTLAEGTDLPELRALSGMFDRWQEEILNYFTYRVTQGFVEGSNNRAKAFERRAYGYRNVENLRLHLLLAR
jgi:transposase